MFKSQEWIILQHLTGKKIRATLSKARNLCDNVDSSRIVLVKLHQVQIRVKRQ